MSPSRRHIVLGTAGHIDHGKTALVRALTGVDTDRLAEEKRRGITIELGFAPWRLSDELEASIVDVPGHERLVRTMVAGAGGMDLALLVVAADDGVMPQTREHLDVLRLLGVPRGLVVITKSDLVDDELLELVEDDVRETCRGTLFEAAPSTRTSSKTGLGLETLRARVVEMAREASARPSAGPLFMPLDRVFHKAGHGTIVTGTSLRGSVRVGDTVWALGDTAEPFKDSKVRGLQALGATREQAEAGMRTAVNLAGRNVEAVRRGMVLCHADSFVAVDAAVAWLEVLPHAQALEEETLTTHLGTAERETRCIPLGTTAIEPGGMGGALLRFAQPIAAYAGQRLVLRRPGLHGQATVAGGEVLDPEPPRGKGAVALAATQVSSLRGPVEQRLLALARESRAAGIDAAALVRRLPPGAGESAALELEARGDLVRIAPNHSRWLDVGLVNALAAKVARMVQAHHDAEPLSPGLPEASIQSQLPPPERHLAEVALRTALASGQVERDGTLLNASGRGAAVDEEAREQMDAIAALYRDSGSTPPGDGEVASRLGIEAKRLQHLLVLLRRDHTLTRVKEGLHFHSQVLTDLEHKVVELLQSQDQMGAPEFKTLAGGVSRKWAIPLLEYLDRQRVTLRVGDARRLHPSRRQSGDDGV